MSTSLFAIANHNLNMQDMNHAAMEALARLQKLKLERAKKYEGDRLVQVQGDWVYRVDMDDPYSDEILLPSQLPDYSNYKSVPYIDFYGPYCFFPEFFKECMLVSTIHKYGLIYENHSLDWFNNFRRELYSIVKIFGGTEVIYLADSQSFLAHYLEGGVYARESYSRLKEVLLREVGEPVTDFSKLDKSTFSYKKREYFLDDFRDLKQ
jgi:hypothetical protein